MTAVDLPLTDLDDLGAAVLPIGNSMSMLYAEKAKQPPSAVNVETQEVTVSRYEGSRAADGLFEGPGYAEFTSGNTYDGLFHRGQIHGQGKYIWTDGLVFTGNFMNNSLSGTGTYEWPSGAKYEGDVSNGKRHGFGTMRFAGSDVVYTGHWQDSKRHGQGKMVYDKAKKCFYEGGWQSNLKHGQGTMHYSSGNIYTGGWEADHKQGQGCMQWGEGEQYTGQWANGLQNGIGQHVWMQPAFPGASASTNHAFFLRHNRYEGMFKDGQRHGYGALYYATGASYEGEWQHEQKHGRGVFTFEDGTVFDGMFAEDQAVLKEGQAWGPIGLGVKLRVHDLLEDGDNKQAVLTALSNELLCVNTELRVVYDAYSGRQGQRPWAWGQPEHSAALNSAQLWLLLRECNVPEPDCSLADINMALAQACSPPPQVTRLRSQLASPQLAEAVGGGVPQLHTPIRQLLFWDFCEALVRIAHLKFRHLPSLQQRLHQLLHTLILPHAIKSNKSNLWLQDQSDADVQALSASTAALQPLFLQIAQLEPSSSSTTPAESVSAENNSNHDSAPSTSTHGIHQANSSGNQVAEHDRNDQERQLSWTSTSISLRRALQTLQKRGLLGAGISMQQALQAFQNACYAGCQAEEAGRAGAADSLADILNLDSTMVFPEFVEGLARCCALEARQGEQDSWVSHLNMMVSKI
ncbi:TPA: Cadherin member 2 [Trebouxia sp. C0005]